MNQQDFFKRFQYSVRKDKIGEGAFGTIYKAYDTYHGQTVAIKVSAVRVINGKEFSLQEEFKAIKDLPAHPNIAHYKEVYTFVEGNGINDYAIMQYYPDGNLKMLIERDGLSYKQRESLLLQLLRGIGFLHQHRVLHRDLKPSNILIQRRDTLKEDKYIIKITDFGLSKVGAPSAYTSFSNSSGGGTICYSSPEQLLGKKLRDNTDLWSFGVIAYEVLTGKALFAKPSTNSPALNENEVIQNILNKDMDEDIMQLPKRWQPALAACLLKDSDGRVRSAERLLDLYNNAEKDGETIIQDHGSRKSPKAATEENKARPKIAFWEGLGITTLIILGILIVGIFSLDIRDLPIFDRKARGSVPVPFKENSLYGYRLNNDSIIPPRFIAAGEFKDGKAEVKVNDSIYYIDQSGEMVQFVKVITKADHDRKTGKQAGQSPPRKQLKTKVSTVSPGTGEHTIHPAAPAEPVVKAPEPAPAADTGKEIKNTDDQYAWQRAMQMNTRGAYEQYIAQYPEGAYAAMAKERIRTINAEEKRTADERKQKQIYEPEMVFVGGGTFEMGNNNWPNSQPVHEVSLSGFWIGKTEVTVEQYRSYCEATGKAMPWSPARGWHDGFPMVYVTWNDARDYCRWLSSVTGKHYRLPTDAEWQYAARGGGQSSGYLYCGSNEIGRVAWYNGNSGGSAHPVAQKEPNELGIYDMSGNVWEWCRDQYGDNYYENRPVNNSQGIDPGTYRIKRGGGFNSPNGDCPWVVYATSQSTRSGNNTGFRVVLDP